MPMTQNIISNVYCSVLLHDRVISVLDDSLSIICKICCIRIVHTGLDNY